MSSSRSPVSDWVNGLAKAVFVLYITHALYKVLGLSASRTSYVGSSYNFPLAILLSLSLPTMLLKQTHLAALAAPGVTLVLALLTFYFVLLRDGWTTFDVTIHRLEYNANLGSEAESLSLIPFWRQLVVSLEAARPQCSPVRVQEGEMEDVDKKWEPLKEKVRPDRLDLPENDEKEIEQRHRQMRLEAKRLAPLLPIGHDTGIVTTGGLYLLPVLLVSLRMLRRTGCNLPVEVFLGDRDEYNAVADVCNKVLPDLNARCHVISDIYSSAENASIPHHFQFKVLAILFSTFKKVLFLDADAFPAHNPTPLFKSAPFTTHGLVIWPGFYTNCASPHFYHIAGITVPPVNRGTESGMILLNKEQHRESLLMMVYYNYYGPDYYYPLQAQGGPGQGDKETFCAGAQAVNAPFYSVKTPVKAIGHHVNGRYVFAGAAQADPMQDFIYEPPPPTHVHPEYTWNNNDKIGAEAPDKATAKAFFVHTVASHTKLFPAKLLKEGGLAYMANEDWHRIWGDEEWIVENFGFDVEKRMWECVQEESCRTDKELCDKVKRYRAKVFGIEK